MRRLAGYCGFHEAVRSIPWLRGVSFGFFVVKLMFNVPAAHILGVVALIAAGGCGSGSGRPTVPPPDGPPARVPSTVPLNAVPSGPAIAIEEAAPPPVPGYRRSFDAPLRPAVATGDPELDPLVAYLKASFAVAIKEGHRLVIDNMTDVEMLHMRRPYQDLVNGLLRHASDQVPAEMIRDFGEKNRNCAVWPELPRHLPAIRVRPVNHIFTKIRGHARLFGAPSSRHSAGGRQRPRLSPGRGERGTGQTDSAARTITPRSSGVMTNPGLRCGQSVAASPAWRNSCQRSGSSSSIRFAGWVLIRSSTSRR